MADGRIGDLLRYSSLSIRGNSTLVRKAAHRFVRKLSVDPKKPTTFSELADAFPSIRHVVMDALQQAIETLLPPLLPSPKMPCAA